jgi:FtsH-binding integral membrane protein
MLQTIRHGFRNTGSIQQLRYFASSSIDEKKQNIVKTPNVDKLSTAVGINYGLKQFMGKVMMYTSGGVAGSLGISLLAMPIATTSPLITFGAGTILAFGSCYGLSKGKTTTHEKMEIIDGKKEKVLYSESDDLKKFSFGGLIVGMGLTMSQLSLICMNIDPMIIPKALVATLGVSAGTIWWSSTRPTGSLIKWQAPLMGCLTGFVGMGLLSLGSALILGPNAFFQTWQTIDTYAGIPLFAAIMAYDIHIAVTEYNNKNPDHLGISASLYLDVLNILIRMMEIFAKMKRD